MKQSIRLLLAPGIVGLALATATSQASANHVLRIRVDNSPNGSGCTGAACFGDTQSGDTITVHVKFKNSCNGGASPRTQAQVLSSVSGQLDFDFASSVISCQNDPCNVEKVWLTTDGNDWFWVDQIEVQNGAGTEMWEAGIDNTLGWCLSGEAADGWNDVCYPNGSFYQAPSEIVGGTNHEAFWFAPAHPVSCP